MHDTTATTGMPRVAQWKTRIRDSMYAMLHGLVPSTSAIVIAHSDEPIDDAHFEEAFCRNCGKPRPEPHCGSCGQKAVARLDLKDVWREFWNAWRLFEATTAKATMEMVLAPGRIAREYVLGARKRHVHPLKLLLYAVGLMLVVMHQTQWLTAGQAQYSAQMKLVAAWSRWSFTLSLFAVLVTSLLVFGRRLGYNPVEHLVLALYVQFLVVVSKLVNMLPLLALDPSWVAPWRDAAKYYMLPVEVLIVAVAFKQFFRLQWRRDAWRIGLAIVVFLVLKRALQYGYGRLIQQALVMQLG